MLLFNAASRLAAFNPSYFNTSNVTIQLIIRDSAYAIRNFNTSNVTIQHFI